MAGIARDFHGCEAWRVGGSLGTPVRPTGAGALPENVHRPRGPTVGVARRRSPTDDPALTRRLLAGRYVVGRIIGRGGMATVHRARDLRSSRHVAIKVLRPELAGDEVARSRFRREARTLLGLAHPNVVTVTDTGDARVASGRSVAARVPYLVLEYVPGRSLRELLASGDLTLAASVRHHLAVLRALEHTHRTGVVHRDIKPSNVMVTPEGVVKVIDFGIAWSATELEPLTRSGTVLGSARCIAPEQVLGGVVDARSDLYSAGCLLHELLTGQPPFVGEGQLAVAYQHVHAAVVPVSARRPELGRSFDDVVDTALAKDPDDRFPTARAFGDALRSAVARRGDHVEVDGSRPVRRARGVTLVPGGS